MAKIQMKLAQEQKLYVFSEVVKWGSITEAAKILCMTQPAVSTIIRQLEQHFGTKLVDVNHKKIYFTAAAKMLNEEWIKLHIAIDNLHYQMNQFSKGVSGNIRIAIVSSAKYFVPRVMCNYMHQYPNVKFECDIKHRANILPSLEKGIYDVAILTNPMSYTTLTKFYLGNNKLIFIAEPNHPIFKRKKVSLQQLANENFVIREQSAAITQMLFDLFQSKQLNMKTLLEIDSTEAIKQAVISGLAIALVPEISVAVEIKHQIVKKIQVNDIHLQNDWYVVCNKNFQNINLIKYFIDYLKSQVTQIFI